MIVNDFAVITYLNIMKYFVFAVFATLFIACSEPEAGKEIVRKSIEYHDPNGEWEGFQGTLDISLEMGGGPDRRSYVALDKPNGVFSLTELKAGDTIKRYADADTCFSTLNGVIQKSDSIIKAFRLSCDNTKMYRDYYSYLYGLPMKLKDSGTKIDANYERVNFKGGDYLKVKVTYDEAIGKDTWYFYFHPETYSLEAYQFFHDEEKNDGEYILLKGIKQYGSMKIPKDRRWYYNENNKYLGADILNDVLSK